MVSQLASYRYWEDHLHRNNFGFGQFGENFTIEGLADDEVCIGDRYRIGNALFGSHAQRSSRQASILVFTDRSPAHPRSCSLN